jgi:hypothetical protein
LQGYKLLEQELKNYFTKAVQEPMNEINQQRRRERMVAKKLSGLGVITKLSTNSLLA